MHHANDGRYARVRRCDGCGRRRLGLQVLRPRIRSKTSNSTTSTLPMRTSGTAAVWTNSAPAFTARGVPTWPRMYGAARLPCATCPGLTCRSRGSSLCVDVCFFFRGGGGGHGGRAIPFCRAAAHAVQYGTLHEQRRLEAELESLEYRLSDRNLTLLPEYEQRLRVLTQLGYVDDKGAIQLKGRVACEVRRAAGRSQT